MSLDPTAREANVRDSLKKYFKDNFQTIEGIRVSFEKTASPPTVQGVEVDRWISVNMGDMIREAGANIGVELYCCTRKDSEGFKLAQLVDTVLGYLRDSSMTDGMARVKLYRSHRDSAWEEIGGMVVYDVVESPELEASDLTKYKILNCRFGWGAKI